MTNPNSVVVVAYRRFRRVIRRITLQEPPSEPPGSGETTEGIIIAGSGGSALNPEHSASGGGGGGGGVFGGSGERNEEPEAPVEPHPEKLSVITDGYYGDGEETWDAAKTAERVVVGFNDGMGPYFEVTADGPLKVQKTDE